MAISGTKDRYRMKISGQLEKLSKAVGKFHDTADRASQEFRFEYYQELSSLRAKLEAAYEWFERVKNAGDEEWNVVKEGMDGSLDLVRRELDDIRSEHAGT